MEFSEQGIEKLKDMISTHGKIVRLKYNCAYSYCKAKNYDFPKEDCYSIGPIGRKFIETFFEKIPGKYKFYKLGTDEDKVLKAIERVSDALGFILNNKGFQQCIDFIRSAQHELIWCDSIWQLKLLAQYDNNISEMEAATLGEALQNEEVQEDYAAAMKKAKAVNEILAYIDSHQQNAQQTIITSKSTKPKDIHHRLAQKYSKIIEIRDTPSAYHLYDRASNTWDHNYMDDGVKKFIENELSLVNVHMKNKHRVFSVSKSEFAAIEALAECYGIGDSDVSTVYYNCGWQEVAKYYIKINELLKNPLFDVELLDNITNIGYDKIPNILITDVLNTGKSWKEAVLNLKNKNSDFAEEWDSMIEKLQEHKNTLAKLLPYFAKYLPNEYEVSQ